MQVNQPRVFFDRLVHDAALYPPGNASMGKAVSGHFLSRRSSRGNIVGPLLCPASRLSEMQEALPVDEVCDLALLGTDAIELAEAHVAVVGDERLTFSHLEVALGQGNANDTVKLLRSQLPDVAVFVEIPRSGNLKEFLDVLVSYGYGAKMRTGGLVAEAFPSEEELAIFLHESFVRGLEIKLTAGLHRALRHSDTETGFEHHGFINVLFAVCQIVEGADLAKTVETLGERDHAVLVAGLNKVDSDVAKRARALFVGYGSCSIDEPYEELVALCLVGSG